MTIQSPEKIHLRIGDSYLCNRACFITESKCTKDIEKVRCKNCLREIAKGRHNESKEMVNN